MWLFCSCDICRVLNICSIKTNTIYGLDIHGVCLLLCVNNTHYLFLPRVSRAEGRGEGGGARLAVPRHAARLGGAADGQGVNTVGVAIAVTAVLLPAAITWRPDKDRAESSATLGNRKIYRDI